MIDKCSANGPKLPVKRACDRIRQLRRLGRSWREIANELRVREDVVLRAYKAAGRRPAFGVRTEHPASSTSHSQLLTEADYPPLRQVLQRLASAKPHSEVYPALLRMLDRGGLVFYGYEVRGRPVRIWAANGDTSLMEIVEEIEGRIVPSKPSKAMCDYICLELFVMGVLNFTTDVAPVDVWFGLAAEQLVI